MMKQNFRLAIVLLSLWLGLSGHLEPLLLSLGIASSLLTLFIVRRMDRIDGDWRPSHINFALLRFWVYLAGEVIRANLHVIRCILHPRSLIHPQLIEISTPLLSRVGRVTHANSITLTPGTVTLQLNEHSLLIHALSEHSAEGLRTDSMAKRVPDDCEG